MNNKIALVTGGLSGIGKGAVIELAKNSIQLLYSAVQMKKLLL